MSILFDEDAKKYSFTLMQEIDIGDLGIIYLIHWRDNSPVDIIDRYRKSYFCIYLPLERNNDAENVYSLFKTDIKNNIVTEGSMLSSILTDYIDRELSEGNFPMEHLYSKGEDAIQGVFNKLHREGKYSKYITK